MDSFTKAMLINRAKFRHSGYYFVSIDFEKYPDCNGKLGLPDSGEESIALFNHSEIPPSLSKDSGMSMRDPYQIIYWMCMTNVDIKMQWNECA